MTKLFTIEDVVKANDIFMKMTKEERKQLPKIQISKQEINYAFGEARYKFKPSTHFLYH